MKLYSYVVRVDGGVAPNPEKGICTLACCKPVIRRKAQVGDWVVGTGSVENIGQHKMVYAMKVSEVLTSDEYFKDKRFKKRVDNIYHKEGRKWVQEPNNFHSDPQSKKRDLGGKNVLIGKEFYYLGKKGKELYSNKIGMR
jgi:hypothetical protein